MLVPFLEASSGTAQTLIYFSGNTYTRVKWLKVILDVSTYMIGALEFISGVCLITAVCIISRYVDKIGGNINKRALTSHATSFGIYMLSIVILDYFYADYQINPSKQTEGAWLGVSIFWTIASFVS